MLQMTQTGTLGKQGQFCSLQAHFEQNRFMSEFKAEEPSCLECIHHSLFRRTMKDTLSQRERERVYVNIALHEYA